MTETTVENNETAEVVGTTDTVASAEKVEVVVQETKPAKDDSSTLARLLAENKSLKDELNARRKVTKKAVTKRNDEQQLKPYQAEIIKLQQHLER